MGYICLYTVFDFMAFMGQKVGQIFNIYIYPTMMFHIFERQLCLTTTAPLMQSYIYIYICVMLIFARMKLGNIHSNFRKQACLPKLILIFVSWHVGLCLRKLRYNSQPSCREFCQAAVRSKMSPGDSLSVIPPLHTIVQTEITLTRPDLYKRYIAYRSCSQ